MTGLVIVIGMLLFSHVLTSKGNADSHESEVPPVTSCDYMYDIQPAQTALSCNVLTAIVLQCQVSSARSNFSISWHHSTSEPQSSNIPATKYIHNSTSTVIITDRNYFHNTSSLVSELTINEFSEKHNGYYWCSVNSSNGTDTTTPNPSAVLHILHQIDCAANVESSECDREVYFYSSSSRPGRCADQDVSVDIIEAQNCTLEDLSDIATTMPTLLITDTTNIHSSDSPNANSSNMQNEMSTINILMTKAPSLHLTLGIIIGASMGGLILVLFITIGLLLACMVRMKVHLRHQGRAEHHKDDPTSSQSADDIHTYSSIPLSDKRDDSNRISTMPTELNVSYECLCPQAVTSQANDNVYDYIIQ